MERQEGFEGASEAAAAPACSLDPGARASAAGYAAAVVAVYVAGAVAIAQEAPAGEKTVAA